MRLLLLIAAAVFAASAWFAPGIRASRPYDEPEVPDVVLSASERIARGKAESALGLLLTGYEEESDANPGDAELGRGRLRTALLLGAAAMGQDGLVDLVRRNAIAFLPMRAKADADGSFVRGVAREWLDTRLQHQWWKARSGAAIYLAAGGDPRGVEIMREYCRQGNFYEEFFPYATVFQPAWRAVEPVARDYLQGGDLGGRVQAGTALLLYRTLYGKGSGLFEEHKAVLRSALLEAKNLLGPTDHQPRDVHRGNSCLLGLAMFGDEGTRGVLGSMRAIDFPSYIYALRIARLLAGLDSLAPYKVTSREWTRLEFEFQRQVFRSAGFRLARALRCQAGELTALPGEDSAAEIPVARKLLEAGLYSSDDLTRVYCLRVLATLLPGEFDEALRTTADGGGVPSLYAALLLDDFDRVPVLLPGMSSPDPGYSSLAAVGILAEGDQIPIERGNPPQVK